MVGSRLGCVLLWHKGSPQGLANTNHSLTSSHSPVGWGCLGTPQPSAPRGLCAAVGGVCFPLSFHITSGFLQEPHTMLGLLPQAGNPPVQILPLVSCSPPHCFGECVSGFLSSPLPLWVHLFFSWLLVSLLTTTPTLWLAEMICSVPLVPPCTCSSEARDIQGLFLTALGKRKRRARKRARRQP